MQYTNENYFIYDDVERVDLPKVKELLSISYWASERTIDVIEKSVENSECFSLYDDEIQIGFARVVSDFSTFGYIADVIVDPDYRGQGLGKWLVETVVNDPRWKGKFLMLATDDAHGLYQKHGFKQSPKFMGFY
ncbi:GNAT family N-acetyltransferase [Pseudoalteromonas sp. HM-SA03]|uniref:GNAT family N-acetyltransferase n=1 Tax=Pseudoalteromonas sp. HM-SA03 TaxID=2029678 RepID=UPI000BAE07CE|nr:GNAT family N-acetyltransferase [Pseudoalteromonas sp. HM-SA03]PAY02733.1 GNAT family N-acetyltransferase [Pseudoalteromonas sp. HM-SA03]